jgi:hypothetical protein
MAKKNATSSQLKYLQDTWKEGYSSIKKSSLEKQGFDTKPDKIELGNFRLVKGFLFGDFDLVLIDKSKDLDNNPIGENKSAKAYLQALLRQGITEIHSKELLQFNLNTKVGKMIFENITIYQIGISDRYRIDLVDKERGIENKIKGENIDFKKVLHVIEKYKLSKKKLAEKTEVQLNKELEDHFRDHFESAQRSSGNLRGAFDLELGKMHFVIELKLAASLKKTGERDRASGQAKRYLQEFKKTNFLMLVIGEKSDKADKNVISLEHEIKNDYKCYFHFLEAM